MTWTTQDRNSVWHEGAIVPVFDDGEISDGSSWFEGGGHVAGMPDGSARSSAEVVGWRVQCSCGDGLAPTATWTSVDFWTRVPSAALEDIEGRRVFAADDDTLDVGYRDDVSEAARRVWLADHAEATSALDDIRTAVQVRSAAEAALTAAVICARNLEGATWAAIGEAAGITGPAAHQRWASRMQEQPSTAGPTKPPNNLDQGVAAVTTIRRSRGPDGVYEVTTWVTYCPIGDTPTFIASDGSEFWVTEVDVGEWACYSPTGDLVPGRGGLWRHRVRLRCKGDDPPESTELSVGRGDFAHVLGNEAARAFPRVI